MGDGFFRRFAEGKEVRGVGSENEMLFFDQVFIEFIFDVFEDLEPCVACSCV